MQRELIVKGASLGNSSDLTLLAPLKPGFVESLESVTFKTRTRRVLAALHAGRRASHEHAQARLLSDAVERVGAIQSVRVAVLEPANQVMLAVSFDGPWEAYIRVLWEKVGTLLDLVFCGTVDYVTAHGHGFDEWLAWARRVQVQTDFFYGPPDFTAQDVRYQRRLQHMRAQPAAAMGSAADRQLDELRAVLPSAEEATARLLQGTRGQAVGADEPAPLRPTAVHMTYERVRSGMQSLAALYRLCDLHPQGSPDGDVVLRAAHDLLGEFRNLPRKTIEDYLGKQRERFARQLAWLFDTPLPGAPARPLPDAFALPPAVRVQAQGGILRPYINITDGAVLLMHFDSATGAAVWLARALATLTRDQDDHDGADGRVFVNVGLTAAGLAAAGLPADDLDALPEDFRQGMAARCSALGDLHHNHPRRWRLPLRHTGMTTPPAAPGVEMSAVHAVVLLRCGVQPPVAAEVLETWLPQHPLHATIASWEALGAQGARLLAVQPLRRRTRTLAGTPTVVEHFGYADGQAQPQVEWGPKEPERDHVHLGEVLLGHGNARDPAPTAGAGRDWCNSSFLVMRKYRQFVDRLRDAVEATATQITTDTGACLSDSRERVYGKLMGRGRDASVLADPAAGRGNQFDYGQDPAGSACPLHAHIRRANPRPQDAALQRFPRLMRRSMAYGPAAPEDAAADDTLDRGLVFMAYNASLGEQFEVVQRWLAGGNSTGAGSHAGCPIVGVPEDGLPRRFRFEHDGRPYAVELDASRALFDEPLAPTRLEWGLYLLAPSVAALEALARHAKAAADAAPVPWELQRGRTLLHELKAVEARGDRSAAREAWKAAIEDPEAIERLDAAALWAAIRRDEGGLLHCAYGTLVADRDLVAHVYLDPDQRYSVSGQFERMKRSFGEIALGLDDGPMYREQSREINAAIGRLQRAAVEQQAFDSANAAIDRFVAMARQRAEDVKLEKFELQFDAQEVLDEVLADLSEAWFGLEDGRCLQRGGQDLAWDESRPPLYPGHFTALSRYMFQPHPGPVPTALGQRYGRALRDAMLGFVKAHRAAGTRPQWRGKPAPLADALFDHPTLSGDDGFVSRAMVGVLMGFNPTLIGAVLNVLAEWRREGEFAAQRSAFLAAPAQAATGLTQSLRRALRARPMPQIGWRTVRSAHRLGPAGAGGVDLAVGDLVVMAMVSGTHQSLEDGQDADEAADRRLMFGGRREAVAPSPTHACPGYEAGMGAMQGVLRALLTRPDALREGPAAGSFVIEGDTALAGAGAVLLKAHVSWAPELLAARSPALKDFDRRWADATARQVGAGAQMRAWGDSWVDYRLEKFGVDFVDLRDALVDLGYALDRDRQFADFLQWGLVTQMASPAGGEFARLLKISLDGTAPPRAVLLSGGGNDSTTSALKAILNPAAPGVPVFNANKAGHVQDLIKAYRAVLTDIRDRAIDRSKARPPLVLLHGYDHPIPAGRSSALFGLGQGAVREWLFDPFVARGYVKPAGSRDIDLPVATKAMKDLINDLNDGLATFHKCAEFPWVRYVDLRDTIADFYPANVLEGWDNDLHPEKDMFRAMALKLHDAIQAG